MTSLYHLESEQATTGQFAISTWAKPNGLGAVMVPDTSRGSEGR